MRIVYIAGLLVAFQVSPAHAAKETFERTKPHCNVGTIGHVDHGKTNVLEAIRNVVSADGLPKTPISYEAVRVFGPSTSCSEQVKFPPGVSFNLARVSYQTAERHYAHVDAPGHADYIKQMITHAGQMEGAILVVSATDGPMPQTREHILLARQVGVPAVVAFLNRADEVDPDQADAVELELRVLLRSAGYLGAPVVRGNAEKALRGDPAAEQTIRDLLASMDLTIPDPEREINKPFLMPVEDVFTISGRGTVATGHVTRGLVQVGDDVEILGGGRQGNAMVIGVEQGTALLEHSSTTRVTLNGTASLLQVERGDAVAAPGSLEQARKFRAQVYVLTKEEGGRDKPFFTGYRPQFYFRTTDVTGSVQLPTGTDFVVPGDNIEMDVELISQVAMTPSLRFAVREGKRTVGVGAVTEVVE